MPPRTQQPPQPGRTPTAAGRRLDLDVVRGIAILLALGWHFSRTASGNPLIDWLQWPGGTFGWAGVDLFFVLSGFLMGRLVLRERDRTGRFDGRRFTIRRALKLWPVLYLFLVVHALLGAEPLGSYLWQNALHVQNYAGTSLPHLWSLAVEEHFYLVLAVLFPFIVRRRSPRLLIGLLTAVLVAALVFRIHGYAAGVSDVRLQWRTHYRMDSLAAGVLLAVVSVHRPAVLDAVLRRRWLLLIPLVTGIGWLAGIGDHGPLGDTVGYTVAYLTAAAFLLLLYRSPWVPRLRWVTAPVAFLGRYSYGIYIWHIFAAQLALGLLELDYRDPRPVAQVVKYVVAIGVGVTATALVERPVLRLRDRLVPAGSRPVDLPTGDAEPVQPPREVAHHPPLDPLRLPLLSPLAR